jgi:signal transduction histidine kinase
LSFAQSWRSEPIPAVLRRTARSAVWRLTAGFAGPLILGAALFVIAAYLLVVRADTATVERAVQDNAADLLQAIHTSTLATEAETTDPDSTSSPQNAANNLVKARVDLHVQELVDHQAPTTFYRFEVSRRVWKSIVDNRCPVDPLLKRGGAEPPRKQTGAPHFQIERQCLNGDSDFALPIPVDCPWWSLRQIGQCIGIGRPAEGDGWYYVVAEGSGAHWGLARRFDFTPKNSGGPCYLFVGARFAMDRIERELISVAVWTLGASALATLLVGFWVSRRMLRRIEAVNTVCDRVLKGDLAARAGDEAAADEFGELSRHVNTMLDQINSLVHGLRDVSNRIAHDLRTPIARLKTDIEGAANAPTLEAAQAGATAAAAETEEILATFQALLDIAEVEAGADGGLQPIHLDDAARSAADLYQAVAEDAGVTLVRQLEPALMLGEPSLIVRLIANLVDNAIKFSPKGAQVLIRVERRDMELLLEVRDQGPGVPAEDRETVMRRFVRGEATRATPGHGLGLALVAAVAKRHGAKIQMDNAGPGLIVRVRFRAF